MPAERRQARLRGLDAMRGFAALGVVVLHVCFYTARPSAPWTVGEGLLQGLRLGVPMFFVLSGFLLTRPWLEAARGAGPQPRSGAYLLRRAARVLPAYWAALAFAGLTLAGTASDRLPEMRQLPLLVTLWQNWDPAAADKLFPPAWTLAVETTFYFVLPLVGLVLVRWCPTPRRQLALCGALAGASIVCNALIEAFGPDHWHRTLPGLGYAFALGMAGAVVAAHRTPGRRVRSGLIAGGWALVVFDALAHQPLALPGQDVWSDLPAAIGFATIIVAVVTARSGPLDVAPLRWLGARSYGLFLLHYPVILMLATRDALPTGTLPALTLVLAVSLALAEVCWRMVEQPVLRLVRRRAPRPYRREQLASASA